MFKFDAEIHKKDKDGYQMTIFQRNAIVQTLNKIIKTLEDPDEKHV